jgi:hypothetical protein
VPLPQVASAIEAGAPPISTQRPDLTRALVEVIESALAVEPARRPPAERLAAHLRQTLDAPREERSEAPRPRRITKPKPQRAPKPAAVRVPIERQLIPAALAALSTVVAATLLPFWTPGLVLLLALAAGAATLRSPRLGLAITLFAPVFPLGNLAQAAALAYAAVALGWLALCWRDSRAGLLFVAGPLLASFGALALLPLAVQPARGPGRRAVYAFAGVLAAALVAGVRGKPLPLTGSRVGDLGLAGTTRLTDVGHALTTVLAGNAALLTTGLTLAAASVLLPTARRFGLWGIAMLGVGQLGLILLAAPSIPALSIVLGTWALCGILASLPPQSGRYP